MCFSSPSSPIIEGEMRFGRPGRALPKVTSHALSVWGWWGWVRSRAEIGLNPAIKNGEKERLGLSRQASVEKWMVLLNPPTLTGGSSAGPVVRKARRGDLPGRRRWPRGQGLTVTCLSPSGLQPR